MAARCKVCGGRRFAVIYKGKIRSGGVGSKSVEGYKVLECRTCRLNFLSPLPEHLEKYYESDEYREQYDYTIDEKDLAEKYACEQNDRLRKIGMENLQDKVIADYGSGIGLFLDLVKGIAKKTIAVEPMKACEEVLKRKGHDYYKYPSDVRRNYVDIALAFELLQHISDPVPLLREIRKGLKSSGVLYVTVPNGNDILMNAHKEEFQRFFYCTAHAMYYNVDSLTTVLERSGFRIEETSGIHKYDFHNLLCWLKFKKPMGRRKLEYVDVAFENNFRNELIRLNLSSHVFIKAIKNRKGKRLNG